MIKEHNYVSDFKAKQVTRVFIECDQEIRVNFHRFKILILVVDDGSPDLMRVTTPCHIKICQIFHIAIINVVTRDVPIR